MTRTRPSRRNSSSNGASDLKSGGWKLAYADFVTSMMCFFMLMWLLNSTPSQSLKSIATYFQPTIGFFAKTGKNETSQNSEKNGNTDKQSNVTEMDKSSNSTFVKLAEQIQLDLTKNQSNTNFSVASYESGIEISIFDNNAKPMFRRNGIDLTDDAAATIARITKSLLYLPNHVVIGGYIDRSENDDGWNISAARANSAMRIMRKSGLPEERIAKLVAYADNLPMDQVNPESSQNRRVTITILTDWHGSQYKKPICETAISLK